MGEDVGPQVFNILEEDPEKSMAIIFPQVYLSMDDLSEIDEILKQLKDKVLGPLGIDIVLRSIMVDTTIKKGTIKLERDDESQAINQSIYESSN